MWGGRIMDFVKDLTKFLFSKKTRMIFIPAIIFLFLISVLLSLSQGAAWAPFVYAVF